MKLTIFILFLVCISIVGLTFWNTIGNNQPYKYKKTSNKKMSVLIGDKTISAEVVDTPEKMMLGLGGRSYLPEGNGMLFVFDKPRITGFWMKDMLIPIDIIWIANDKIAYINHELQPPKSPIEPLKRYYPPKPVSYVLEVPAGWTKKNKIKVGDKVGSLDL